MSNLYCFELLCTVSIEPARVCTIVSNHELQAVVPQAVWRQ